MNEVEIRRLVSGIASMIESRKLSGQGFVLIKDAEGGWNMCCDFLAHQLRELCKGDNTQLLSAYKP